MPLNPPNSLSRYFRATANKATLKPALLSAWHNTAPKRLIEGLDAN